VGENLHHATVNLEHSYGVPVARVFSEFADPTARVRWSAPSGDTLVYDSAEFREGGGDVFRCGPPNDLRFRGETTYHVIVPNSCVISTEVLTEGGKRLAIALNTLSFEATGEGTTLKVTVQLVSFVGPGVVEGYESGNKGALEGLARHLSANS
jgi:uncharacterized protein YndB with AHSA1/START domain